MLGKSSAAYKKWVEEQKRYLHMPETLDAINLGSTCDANNFDYSLWSGVNGFNLASAPQDMYYDQQLLEQYGVRLKKNGVVFISISEFAFLCDRYNLEDHNYKYYWYLESDRIINYSHRTDRMLRKYPGLLDSRYMKQEIKQIVKEILRTDKSTASASMESKAQKMMSNWVHEFGWDAGCVIREEQRETIKRSQEIFEADIRFCKKRQLTPVVIIPPFEEHLISLMPNEVLDECLWRIIDGIKSCGIKVISFWKDNELQKEQYYSTPICLNEEGKRLFNRRLQEIMDNHLEATAEIRDIIWN